MLNRLGANLVGFPWRAVAPYAMTILLGICGALSLASPHAIPKPCSANEPQYQRCSAKLENPTLFFEVGDFAAREHDAIEAISGVLADVVALGLAVVTAFLWGATRNLATSTAGLRDAAHGQTAELVLARELSERQLELSKEQLELAGKHFLLADRQNALADRQYGLERQRYLAEHGPRLEIRSIGLARPSPDGPELEAGRPITATLVVRNTGDCDARIRSSEYCFFWTERGLPMVPPLDPKKMSSIFTEHPTDLPGHESLLVQLTCHGALSEAQVAGILAGGPWQLYIMGAIQFSDWNPDKARWMSFCRQYVRSDFVGGEGRFQAISNCDYEYQD